MGRSVPITWPRPGPDIIVPVFRATLCQTGKAHFTAAAFHLGDGGQPWLNGAGEGVRTRFGPTIVAQPARHIGSAYDAD
jgi:hypothetical protein